jgi:hypothetical protein
MDRDGVDRDGVDRDGVDRDGVDRDGAQPDGQRLARPVAAGVGQVGVVAGEAHAATGLEGRRPAIPVGAGPDEAGVDAGARTVMPAVSGAPSHGGWGAIRSRAGKRYASYCMPIGELFGR